MVDVALLVAKCDGGDGLSSVSLVHDDVTLQILRFVGRSTDSERSLNLRVKTDAIEREVEVEKQAQRTLDLTGDALFMITEDGAISTPTDMGITCSWPDPRA